MERDRWRERDGERDKWREREREKMSENERENKRGKTRETEYWSFPSVCSCSYLGQAWLA